VGKIDILVNNARCSRQGVLDETRGLPPRRARLGDGHVLNTKWVGRSMAERGVKGSIVCISSSNGGTAARRVRVRVPQGRREQLRPRRRDGPGAYGIRVNSFTRRAQPDNPS